MKIINFRVLALAILLALLIFVKYGARWSENPAPMAPFTAAVTPSATVTVHHAPHKSKKEQERQRLAKRRANRGIKLRDKGEALGGGEKKQPKNNINKIY